MILPFPHDSAIRWGRFRSILGASLAVFGSTPIARWHSLFLRQSCSGQPREQDLSSSQAIASGCSRAVQIGNESADNEETVNAVLVGAVGIENNADWNFKDLQEILGSAKTLKRNNKESKGILIGPSMAPFFLNLRNFLRRGFFN